MLVESYLGLLNILIRVRGDDPRTGNALINSFKDFLRYSFIQVDNILG